MRPLRIGTRGSPLALWQAHAVRSAVLTATGTPCEVLTIRTTGDQLAHAPLSKVGGKSVFVKEIEESLLAGRVDLAVHSAKDLPADLPAGLGIAAVLPREDPRDALVLPPGAAPGPERPVAEVVALAGPTPRIGTGSVRRVAQLSRCLPGVTFEDIRGNLDTRLRKLDTGRYDLLVLAAAGLLRLNHADRISARLPFTDCLPAPGQGIVAVEIRLADETTRAVLGQCNDAQAMMILRAERALLAGLGGDCHVPIGALAEPHGAELTLTALVASPDGERVLRRERRGRADAPDALGSALAQSLLDDGADELLAVGRS